MLSLDGTTLDVPDTPANGHRFGGPGTSSATGDAFAGGFPQLRVLAVAECGTRALIAARVGSYPASEKDLTSELLALLPAGMLVPADRNFPACDLCRQAGATGADLLWRAGPAGDPPVRTVLADGTYLSELAPRRDRRRVGA